MFPKSFARPTESQMRIEWILLAEGITYDSRGALAAVGLNQNVFAANALPANTKRAVIVRLTDPPENRTVHFRYAVVAASGQILSAQEGAIEFGERRLLDLPAALDVPAEFALSLSEYGEHRIEFEVSDREANETLFVHVPLYVIEASKLGNEVSASA